MAYRIVAKSPKHLNDIIEDVMTWFETARDYRSEFDTESRKFADPATKQIVTKKIDVVHVQDPMTGKKTVIKFIPLLRPEEMKIEMGGENEHVMKGKLKNMMKGRGEFKTYNKDTLRKMEGKLAESDAATLLKQLGQELKSHDWNYQYSDDSRYYNRGSQEWDSIRNIIAQINKMGLQADGETIWKQFAPSDQKNNYPAKIVENKMKKSELQQIIREEVRKTLNEDLIFLRPDARDSSDMKRAKKMLAATLKNLKSIYRVNSQDIEALAEVIWEFADSYAEDRIKDLDDERNI